MFTRDNTEFIVFADQGQRYVSIYYNDDEVIDPEIGFELRRADYDLDDDKNPDVQQILKLWTFEEIELNTRKLKKLERQAFEAEILEIAKRDGLILDPKGIQETNDLKKVEVVRDAEPSTAFELLFKEHDYENEKTKEQLFKCKLMAFELDEVKNSKKRKIKSELRTAKTFREVLESTLKFY